MSRWFTALAATLGVAVTSAHARPFTVDDLLHQESFGRPAFDPSGRRLIFEQHDPYDSLTRYDHDLASPETLSRLKVVDLGARTPGGRQVRDLLPADLSGVTLGPFSPSGARLVVFQRQGDLWRAGIVTLESGAVRWIAATPELPVYGRTVQWRDERRLLLLDRAEAGPPWPLRSGRISAERLPGLWAAQARGEAATTVLGSGRYRALNPPASTRRLLQIDADTGDLEVLAHGAFDDLELSPDGRRLALFESGATVQPRADGPSQGAAGLAVRVHGLRLLDLVTGALTAPLGDADLLPQLLSWSPSGRRLAVFRRGDDGLWTSGRLLAVDGPSGETSLLGGTLSPDLRLRPDQVGTGWMGEDPILRAKPPGGGRADWWRLTAAGPVNLTRALPAPPADLQVADAAGAVALIGADAWRISPDGAARRLTGRFTAVRESTTPPNGRVAARPPAGGWVVETRGDRTLLRRLTSGGPITAIDLPRDVTAADVLLGSRTGPRAVISRREPSGVTRLSLADAQGVRPLAAGNLDLADTDPPRAVAVRHGGPDGRALTSWLFLPAASGASPPPLVVKPYPGAAYARAPVDAAVDRGFVANLRVLTGHGYAVLTPSLPLPRGTTDPMADLGPRILGIVDAAAAAPETRGTFDPQRIAVLGYSHGGYGGMAAITQTDRFKAAVAISGISSLFAIWEYQPALLRPAPEEGLRFNWSTGYTEASQGGMGVPPWRDPQRYVRNSPLFAADRITTPLLLMHGDQDIVPLSQSEAMFSALFRQSKDAVLVTYWGEGHGIMSPGNVRDMYRRIFDFLDAHLGVASITEPSRSAHPGPAPASGGPTPPPQRPAGPGSRGRSG